MLSLWSFWKKYNTYDVNEEWIQPAPTTSVTVPSTQPLPFWGGFMSQMGWMQVAPKQDVLPKIYAPGYTPSASTTPPKPAQTRKNRLFSDEQEAYDAMIADGIDEATALEGVKENRKLLLSEAWVEWAITPAEAEGLYAMIDDGLDTKTAIEWLKQSRTTPDMGMWDTVKEWAIGAFRAGEQIPRVAGNILGFIGKGVWNFLSLWVPESQEAFYKQGGDISPIVEKLWEEITRAGEGSNITDEQRQARRVGGELALSAAVPSWAWIGYVAKGKWLVSKGLRSSWVGAAYWAGFWAATPVMQKWSEATVWDIATWTAGGAIWGAVLWPLTSAAIGTVSWVASKWGKYVTAASRGWVSGLGRSVGRDIVRAKNAVVSPVTWGARTVATRSAPVAVVNKNLGITAWRDKIEDITGMSPGEYVLSKWQAGKSKEELVEFFDAQANQNYTGINKRLSESAYRIPKSEKVINAIDDIIWELSSKPKLARAYKKDIEILQKLREQNEYSLVDINNLRRAYDKLNTGIYDAKWAVKGGAETDIDASTRRALNDMIERWAKESGFSVKDMNKDLRAAIEMRKALINRLSQEERNNLLWLQDLGVAAIFSNDPATALATIVAKKYVESTIPTLAQKAYNLNKTPSVSRNLSRRNPISSGGKSSGIGVSATPTPAIPRSRSLVPVAWTERLYTPETRWIRVWEWVTDQAKRELQKGARTTRRKLAEQKQWEEKKKWLLKALPPQKKPKLLKAPTAVFAEPSMQEQWRKLIESQETATIRGLGEVQKARETGKIWTTKSVTAVRADYVRDLSKQIGMKAEKVSEYTQGMSTKELSDLAKKMQSATQKEKNQLANAISREAWKKIRPLVNKEPDSLELQEIRRMEMSDARNNQKYIDEFEYYRKTMSDNEAAKKALWSKFAKFSKSQNK